MIGGPSPHPRVLPMRVALIHPTGINASLSHAPRRALGTFRAICPNDKQEAFPDRSMVVSDGALTPGACGRKWPSGEPQPLAPRLWICEGADTQGRPLGACAHSLTEDAVIGTEDAGHTVAGPAPGPGGASGRPDPRVCGQAASGFSCNGSCFPRAVSVAGAVVTLSLGEGLRTDTFPGTRHLSPGNQVCIQRCDKASAVAVGAEK